MFVDVHIHLSDEEYHAKVGEVVQEARQVGVVSLISNSTNLKTCLRTLQLSREYQNFVHAALGVHPWNAMHAPAREVHEVSNLIQRSAREGEVLAIGEVGLDFTYTENRNLQDRQVQVFRRMLGLAEALQLPVIVHSRGTIQRVLEELSTYRLRGVLLHWYSGPVNLLPQLIDRGYYISAGPSVVYSRRIRRIVRRVPIENLLAETDGPVPLRGPFEGRLTRPSFLPMVVREVASLKGLEVMEAAHQILQNSSRFFNVDWVSVTHKRDW